MRVTPNRQCLLCGRFSAHVLCKKCAGKARRKHRKRLEELGK